ncbi:hypothetical protein SAMN06296058_1262 [Pseudoxanthomonas indica]|uniref:Uncharacterized protein n=1 Tax=Pseudoxanthomonas indica TaxID=428993 RepID=A0A1T5K135_9GAMM|nr:hypothetical protein GCM10007235_17220 [Pseudoxanthomonas indica]SKC57333.1 hypothetical protein SAMN06296058_1262 [Pseudoxanthomonas indica]
MSRPIRPNYLARAITGALSYAGRDPIEIVIAHSEDCPRLMGRACECQPDITAVLPDGTKADIDSDGRLVPAVDQ